MTTASEADTASELVSFHYILTAQLGDAGQATISDVVHVDPSRTTRSRLYNEIRAYAAREFGYGGFTVVFFALERQQL
ncbi:hypothetical protein ACQB60_18155 [Actinomycetota bacterium Odt1-20B]